MEITKQSKTKASPKLAKVSEDQADAIHSLLVSCMEVGLRQQLLTGDINPALLARVVDWLKYNNVQVIASENRQMQSLVGLLADLDLNSQEDEYFAQPKRLY